MTHLDPREMIDAMEDALAPERRAHLDSCAACRDAVTRSAALRRAVAEVEPTPEPSPLFWDHLSARIRTAVRTEPLPARTLWSGWRAYAALASAVGAVVLAVWVDRRVPPPSATADVAVVTQAWLDAADELTADRPWERAGEALSGLPGDQMASFVAPGATDASMLLTDLSADERRALARLLEAEMGETP